MPRRIALISAICLVIAGCAQDPPTVVTGPTTPLATSAVPPPPMVDEVGAGRWKIGVDIRPGVWRTEGPRSRRGVDVYGVISGPPVCTWVMGYPSEFDDTPGVVTTMPLAHGEVRGPTEVTLNLIGASFDTNHCQTWKFVGPSPS